VHHALAVMRTDTASSNKVSGSNAGFSDTRS
jgi:hypothetical protein